MEGARVFTCIDNNSLRSMLLRKEGKVFLKVDGDRISGKGQICNAEGRNGYLDDFEFSASEISNIKSEEYNYVDAISFDASLKGLYGNKRIKVFLPQLKDADGALALLKSLKQNSGDVSLSHKQVVTAPRPISRDEMKEEDEKKFKTAHEPIPRGRQEEKKPVVTEEKKEQKPIAKEEAPIPEPKFEEPVKAEPKFEEPVKAEPKFEEPTPAPAPEPKKEVAEENTSAAGISEEEFAKRMDKLEVLKDCGLIADSEYTAKKFELLGEFYGLGKFYERIQKLVALKDCGLLSEKEFEENRKDVLKECCDVNVTDINEYRNNVQKLAFLELGEVISDEEYKQSRTTLVENVEFKLEDTKEQFTLKLKRLPVLKECHLIDDEDYEAKVAGLFKMLEVEEKDTKDELVCKISKWPLLVWEKYMDTAELKNKQDTLISKYLDSKWSTPDELKVVINNMMALREGECLTGKEFQARRQQLLSDIDNIEQYSNRVAMYRMLPEVEFISASEYEEIKQKCIDKIFVKTNSVTDFKERANNLVELQKIGMLTDDEFSAYKNKLMSEL